MKTKIVIGILGVVALLVFFVPAPAFAQCAAACPSPTVKCPVCLDDAASYCLNNACVPPAKILSTPIEIKFGAPTSTTTFSAFLCKVIAFINKDILPPIAVFMTLLAGFFFMLSGQDPGKATLAKRILLFTVIGVILFLIAPGIVALIADVLGATDVFGPVSCSTTLTASSVTNTLINLINWFAWFVALASVAMGLYAGFLYLTSRGDPRQTQQAIKTLSYVIIGITVSVLAFSIISLVKTFLGSSTATTSSSAISSGVVTSAPVCPQPATCPSPSIKALSLDSSTGVFVYKCCVVGSASTACINILSANCPSACPSPDVITGLCN